MEIKEIILEFLKEKRKVQELNFDTDLFKGGYVDSLFALEMVTFLEKQFKIRIKNKEINEENFKNINNLEQVVLRSKK